MYRWTVKYVRMWQQQCSVNFADGVRALANNFALLQIRRYVSRCMGTSKYAKYAYDQIDGFLKVTPKAIRNIARGLSLHFRTVNIRSIVVESEALIENTRG